MIKIREKAQKNKTTTAVLVRKTAAVVCILRPMFKKLLHLAAKKGTGFREDQPLAAKKGRGFREDQP